MDENQKNPFFFFFSLELVLEKTAGGTMPLTKQVP